MFVLRTEHSVSDYEAWKRAFDRDPADRKGSGVFAYTVSRSVDDPDFVVIDLGFSDAAAAAAMHEKLKSVWVGLGPDVLDSPHATIFEVVEQGSP
jgi:hypothetical protein